MWYTLAIGQELFQFLCHSPVSAVLIETNDLVLFVIQRIRNSRPVSANKSLYIHCHYDDTRTGESQSFPVGTEVSVDTVGTPTMHPGSLAKQLLHHWSSEKTVKFHRFFTGSEVINNIELVPISRKNLYSPPCETVGQVIVQLC